MFVTKSLKVILVTTMMLYLSADASLETAIGIALKEMISPIRTASAFFTSSAISTFPLATSSSITLWVNFRSSSNRVVEFLNIGTLTLLI
ncbi:hypothetical protein ES703_85132 [subsurface metagenome]